MYKRHVANLRTYIALTATFQIYLAVLIFLTRCCDATTFYGLDVFLCAISRNPLSSLFLLHRARLLKRKGRHSWEHKSWRKITHIFTVAPCNCRLYFRHICCGCIALLWLCSVFSKLILGCYDNIIIFVWWWFHCWLTNFIAAGGTANPANVSYVAPGDDQPYTFALRADVYHSGKISSIRSTSDNDEVAVTSSENGCQAQVSDGW